MSNYNTILKPTLASRSSGLSTEAIDFASAGRRPLTEAITIHHSSSAAFDVGHSINPLIAAAAPLFMAITAMKRQQFALNDVTHFRQSLLQEIKIFESKARKLDYRSAIILAARYFLCAFVDEVMSSAALPLREMWQHQLLLQTLQGEGWGGERIFIILERASDDPEVHIDLLEFGFLCLSLGYRGKYQKSEHPSYELDNIKDNLLVLINRVRGHLPATLFLPTEFSTEKAVPLLRMADKKSKKIPHFLIAAGIFVMSAVGIYFTYQNHLVRFSQPLQTMTDSQ